MHMQLSNLTPVTTKHHQEYLRHAPHMVVGVIFKFISFAFPGLPDGLPDAVCPAAMLQHVFRPPQQQRETNAAVHRPLAPPRAPPTRQTCPLLSPHPFHSRYIRSHNQEKAGKLGMMDMAEERTWIRKKWHALIRIPRLCSLAGWRN